MSSKSNLIAKFALDSDGKPRFIERGGLKHYMIRLGVEGAPEDAYAVTYKLDPSYYDSLREVRKAEDNFQEELTSYGDYVVQADVRSKERVEAIATNLSQALHRGHQEASTPEIESAIKDIENA